MEIGQKESEQLKDWIIGLTSSLLHILHPNICHGVLNSGLIFWLSSANDVRRQQSLA